MNRHVCAFAGLFAFAVFSSSPCQAQKGKVFFKDGKFYKGDIQEQTEPDGKDYVVISMKSGSITVPRSDIASIIYTGPKTPEHVKFHKALSRTVSHATIDSHIKSPTLYSSFIEQASRKHRLDPELIKAVIKQESNFNPRDVSRVGAAGLMQLMPETARKLGVSDSFDPYENIHGGAHYLKMMIEDFNGDLTKALAAYNAGPNAVKRYGRIPPFRETQDYVRKVMRNYNRYRGASLMAVQDRDGRLVITDRPLTDATR